MPSAFPAILISSISGLCFAVNIAIQFSAFWVESTPSNPLFIGDPTRLGIWQRCSNNLNGGYDRCISIGQQFRTSSLPSYLIFNRTVWIISGVLLFSAIFTGLLINPNIKVAMKSKKALGLVTAISISLSGILMLVGISWYVNGQNF